ncbi:hypothetical protein GCM10010172_51860 [Paractinoplanes ferrugineus]|uniref:SalK n=1 Tax=Paractinoplanes ferrugineus TaxID=113564 RepID=A0A919J023_9ACTN|nr:hypothetical protein [Actinoplanes ferrugineus]GIE11995.1 hypothetical protein Afe05nite_38350 [Actinoplanes ferrugineus]
MSEVSVERRMWSLFEPVHAVTYFAPEGGAVFEAAGVRGFWRRYFAGRAAPLGPVGAKPVIAAFFGFAPRMVERALPDIWTRITPQGALDARLEGVRAALAPLLTGLALDEAADLLEAAAREVDLPGRVLGAANADLPWPEPGEPIDRLWHAATILREHRGDGHVAALLTAGVDGCESLVWRCGRDGQRAGMQPARGWTDDEWDGAAERLEKRGWLAADGSITVAGQEAYAEVEALTDSLAGRPWRSVDAARCATLLEPVAERIWPLLPANNPIPLARSQGQTAR